MAAVDLTTYNIHNTKAQVFHNLSYEELAEHERANNEGHFVANGTFAVDTGKFTGRCPKDKYFVKQAPSQDNLDWGKVNQPINGEVFDKLYTRATEYFNTTEKIYIFDGYVGANPTTQKKVRFITELAWQHHFVRNMFIRPETKEELVGFKPDFTIINASEVTNPEWKEQGMQSERFIAFNIERHIAVIGGTRYGGEMKKGIFSMMNYWLPLQGIMAMHCSSNVGNDGDVAIFFGLSGTGKTTLSADPKRKLIGDDEHGWDDEGVFNFEGGCYAKTINLDPKSEPDIYNAIVPNAMLENVWINEDSNEPDYFNGHKTENGRVSYPIYHIPNYLPEQKAGHPSNVIFLTCDAYGVLPPVAKLSLEQAMYQFINGYTSKVAGTEEGVTEPEATFSTCFGAPFMPLHPTKYADLLKSKLEKHGTHVYLVNTGWTAGSYGVGHRMKIKDTRQCIDAILDGSILHSEFKEDSIFGFQVPVTLADIPPTVLHPRDSWADKAKYDATAHKLAQSYIKNYKQYQIEGVTDYSPYGPKA